MIRRHPRSLAALLTGALLAGWIGFFVGVPGSAAADEDDGSVKMKVEVLGTVASPTPRPSPSSQPSGSMSPTSPAPGPSGSGSGTPVSGDPLRGLFHVSGLTVVHRPSINPFGGELVVSFTVRNLSGRTVDATAQFWANHIFGGAIGDPVTVPIAKLKPGETRLIAGTLAGPGQWGFLSVHGTFTPPERMGAITLTPVTRDGIALFLPWLVLTIGGLGGGFGYYRWHRYGQVWGAGRAALGVTG